MLGETDGNVYLWTVLYYDSKGRVTQESHSTHRGGTRRTNTGYDFTGHPTKSRTITQDTLAGDLTELYTYSYDAWGRPLTVTHKLGEVRPVTLHNYSYDGAGRIVWDFRNGDVDLATRYTYNVRNSLTSIKVGGSAQQGTLGETFTEMLYYESPRGGAPLLGVQYAGNVSSMSWMAGSDGVMRSYDFSYDGLSRLTGAAYTDNDNGTGLYTRGYTYDLNGNMTSLTTPSGTTNQSYSGNQFSGTGIDYDFNGNLTDNLGCGLTQVKYNILNLPESCHYSYSVGYHQMVGQESYLYSVNGVKLQTMDPMQIVLPGQPDTRARTDYVGNLVYDRTSLKKILIPGGYIEVSTTGNNYRFFITDHLGNNRLVTDASGTILQTNHYDPYGESLPAGASVDSGNPYKWGNKEYDDRLASYDFGARYYTPASATIPRWTTMDPLCEKYYSISPYAYCAGNPVRFVDPEGKEMTDYYNLNGRLVLHVDDGKDDRFLVLSEGDLETAIKHSEVLPVPSQEVLDLMTEAYNQTKRTGKEAGFGVDINGSPGPIGIGDEHHVDIPSVYHYTGAYVAYDVHTHPKPKQEDDKWKWSNEPSETDNNNHVGRYPGIVLGYDIYRCKSMAFYHKTGIIGSPIPYKIFVKAVKRIHKTPSEKNEQL